LAVNNILDIKTPAQAQAGELAAEYGLENLGLTNLGRVYWNLPTPALYEESLFRREASMSDCGPLVANTGKHTARSANDKYIVKRPSSEDGIWWGQYNRPISPESFSGLYGRLQGFLQGRDLFVQDCWAGASPTHQMPVRIITELAWQSLFARNMFLPPKGNQERRQHIPEFTVISAPSFNAAPQLDATGSGTFIIIDFDQKLCIIGGSAYAGEIKKSIFSVLNYLLPEDGVMPMHCSANVDDEGRSALFFGLSGTGKTTLSADPTRHLIGDDEHGWDDEGIFNFEAGCYAKVIRLSSSAEPQIFDCTRRYGTVLENVVFDPVTRMIDLDDDSRTENTRASYPLEFIANSVPEKRTEHPVNIVLLTCDASGVVPPIAKLTPEQAIYQFISGYTSKVGGTEVGLGAEPEITFSTCFGAPFMVREPAIYAELLRNKITRYGAKCWLVNTGWVGGGYGVGKRIDIDHTRALLSSALDGSLADVEYNTDPVFGFQVPGSCPGVPKKILNPASSWSDNKTYLAKYRQLAARFIDNFKKCEKAITNEIAKAGPRLK
jgi:phosphoenolpyruvate carboxykinase (ATP)